jgi:hypothetical protein
MTYTSDASHITWSWTSLCIQRNQTSISIPNASHAVSSLAASSTFFFYPYLDELDSLFKFGNSSQLQNMTGSPATACTAKTDYNAGWWAQKSHLLLSGTPLNAATTSGVTGGGSGGGSGLCVRGSNTWVISRTRGVVLLRTCVVGEEIKSRGGWRKITRIDEKVCSVFLAFDFEHGGHLDLTPYHQCTVIDPETDEEICVRASRIHSEHLFITPNGLVFHNKREDILVDGETKISIGVDGDHTFFAFCGKREDFAEEKMTLTHNLNNPS